MGNFGEMGQTAADQLAARVPRGTKNRPKQAGLLLHCQGRLLFRVHARRLLDFKRKKRRTHWAVALLAFAIHVPGSDQ